MTGLKAKALAAFEEHAESKEAMATREFKEDFGIAPDETVYMGKNLFLFKADGFYIRGYIDRFPGGRLYSKGYRLATSCRCSFRWTFGEKEFSNLAGLGEALTGLPPWDACLTCKDKDERAAGKPPTNSPDAEK